MSPARAKPYSLFDRIRSRELFLAFGLIGCRASIVIVSDFLIFAGVKFQLFSVHHYFRSARPL